MSALMLPMPKVLYNIQPSKGVGDRKFLSSNDKGDHIDLWTKDDDTGRQKWEFVPVTPGVYNIKIYAGINNNKAFLSCTADGGKVDLYDRDDKSGRQQWKLEENPNGTFHITPAGGLSSNRKYLSATADGGKIDLYDRDDKSGRQQWILLPEELTLTEIKFDLTKALTSAKPAFIVEQTVKNETNAEQESKVTFLKRATLTSSFQEEHGFAVTVSAEKRWGVPDGAGGSASIAISTEHKWTYGREKSEEDSRTYEMPVKIPAMTNVVAKATVSQLQLDVPYTAMCKSKDSGETIEIKGIWQGVTAGAIVYSLKETSL